ncbi:MAG: putative porin [Marinilabiliaceae bacterium]|nr:putative porin [Marinilabiliaceae bacterium]
MKEFIKTGLYIFLAFFCLNAYTQEENDNLRPDNTAKNVSKAAKKIKHWRLIDEYTLLDSVPLDTFVNNFQTTNPVFKKNPFNIHTGNLGSPYQSNSLEFLNSNNDFIFTNSLVYFFPDPSTYLFYNTTVPYTNLSYSYSGPKQRSEDNTRILFTQNITPYLNFGISYNLISSIGMYQGQRNDNQMTRINISYQGEKYSIFGVFAYNDIRHMENGGITDDSFILNPEQHDYPDAQSIPVYFNVKDNRHSKNYLKNYQVFISQSYGIGRIKMKDTTNNEISLPVSTVYHTLKFDSKQRTYALNKLYSYYDKFYSNIYEDSLQTADSTRLRQLTNTFQIRFNEEANTLLKFGMRIFIDNELNFYRVNSQPTKHYRDINGYYRPVYNSTDSLLSCSAIGGQIFKNQGRNFWWNAGIKLYFQGYKLGDSQITGKLNTLFRVKNDTAGIYTSGGLYLNTPGLLLTKYYSNHIKWNYTLKDEKTLKLRGGISIPTRRFDVSAEIRLINDFIFWNQEALPDQASGVIQAYELKLRQHFKLWNLNSFNQVSYQVTSQKEVLPLPTLSLFSSNYYENVLFKVLRTQIGFDIKYHSAYYAPSYFPATGQFYIQNNIKVGDYPLADVFLNFHLKRARLGFKYEHINLGYPNNNYFIIPHYSSNPGRFKIYVSWNFFD